MVIVHNTDMYKYVDKQKKVESIRYSNGVKNVNNGKAIYLPRKIYEGENVFSNIFNFIAKNKNTISNVASATSSIVDSVGKIGNTTLDTIKKIKELRKPAISDDAMNKVLNADNTQKNWKWLFLRLTVFWMI